MAYIASLKDIQSINFAPDTVIEEVLQNVRTLLATIKYEIPLDRAFGLSGDVVDMPIQQAAANLSSEIFSQIKRYEPRAVVENISFEKDLNGRLVPIVEVDIRETG